MKRTRLCWAHVAAVVTGLAAAALLTMATLTTMAFAQNYPNKPVRLLVGFVPGGSTDLAGRFIAQKLGEMFGQQVIVENRPGAGTALANERVAAAAPDGYTLLLMTASGAGLSAARSDLPYDIDRDFVPIARGTATTYVVMVHPSVPVRSVKDLIALARSRPGKMSPVNWADEGSATPTVHHHTRTLGFAVLTANLQIPACKFANRHPWGIASRGPRAQCALP